MREMKSLPEKYQLPLPDITMNAPYIEIVFPRTGNFLQEIVGKIYGSLNEEERKGLLYLHDRDHVSKKEYAEYFGFDEKKAQRHLSKFRKLEIAHTKGNGPSLKYVFTRG